MPAEHCQLVLVMPNAMSEEHDTNTILATLLKKELDCCIFLMTSSIEENHQLIPLCNHPFSLSYNKAATVRHKHHQCTEKGHQKFMMVFPRPDIGPLFWSMVAL